MNQQIIILVSQWMFILAVATGLLFLFTTLMYDMRTITRRRRYQNSLAQIPSTRWPHITVLIYTQNNESTIEACIESVVRSKYLAYDIVIVDDESIDNSQDVIRRYKKNYSLNKLYIYSKRKRSSRYVSIRQAYGKSKKGGIVLVLDGSSRISDQLLSQSAIQFVSNSRLRALRLNQLSDDIHSVRTLLGHVAQLNMNVYRKHTSVLRTGRMNNVQFSTFYHKDALRDKKEFQRTAYQYDGFACVAVVSKSPQGIGRILTVPVFLVVTYFMYLAISLQSSSLLLLSWSAVSLWLLFCVWSNDTSSIRQKLVLMFCIPVIYFLIYAQFFFQLASILLNFAVENTTIKKDLPFSKPGVTEHLL